MEENPIGLFHNLSHISAPHFRIPFAASLGARAPAAEHTHLFPVSDIGAVVETKAPPSMHRMRCLIRTLKDTTKEAKLHEGSASSMRLREYSFSDFLSTRPKRGGGRLGETPRSTTTRVICCFTIQGHQAHSGKTARIIRNYAVRCK